MQRDVIVKWFYPWPPEKVWECLTDSELLGQWLMKNDFRPEVGHKFTFRSTPKPGFKWNGIVYCEVLEIVPLQKITFSWRGGPEDGVVNLDTTVTWLLQQKNGGTELVLEHRGFRGMKNFMASLIMEKGWKKMLAGRFTLLLQKMSV